MALMQQMDAILALIRAKIIPIVQKIKTGDCDAKLSSDVIKVNQVGTRVAFQSLFQRRSSLVAQVLKVYINSLTTQGGDAVAE